jgi:3-(methylthio)propanoyl-CoA dehydrogenase
MAMRTNFFDDNADLQFNLVKMMDWEKLYQLAPSEELEQLSVESWEEYRDAWMAVLSSVGEICGNTLAVNARQVEKEPLKLKENGDVEYGNAMNENLRILKENGLPSIGVNPKFGGLGGPFVVEVAAGEMIARACPSTYLHSVWYSSIAHILESFADEKTCQEVIPKIASGEWSGSMSLTEADAGSDLSAIRTYGEKTEDGQWLIHGSKRFISNGCGDLTLALARSSKDAKGLKALSLFLVMRKLDGQPNYEVTKLEEKIGLHGSPTCELQFDGSKAILLGKEGEGFYYMLRLMNDARIAVGLQGAGMMEAMHRLAAEYADQRKSWGRNIAKHELVAEMLLDMEVETKGLRALCYQAAMHRSLAYQSEKKMAKGGLSDEQRREFEIMSAESVRLMRKWTPLIKWYVGEKSVVHARTGVMIHGGYGFTTEYRAEWWMRESLILALYEGTSQIQALMCIKDTLKEVIRKPRTIFENALGDRWRGLVADADTKNLHKSKQIYNSAIISLVLRLMRKNMKFSFGDLKTSDLVGMIKSLASNIIAFKDLGPALLHAERICEMKTLTQIGNCLIRQGQNDSERKWLAQRFFYRAIPRMQLLKTEIDTSDQVIAKKLGHVIIEDEKN